MHKLTGDCGWLILSAGPLWLSNHCFSATLCGEIYTQISFEAELQSFVICDSLVTKYLGPWEKTLCCESHLFWELGELEKKKKHCCKKHVDLWCIFLYLPSGLSIKLVSLPQSVNVRLLGKQTACVKGMSAVLSVTNLEIIKKTVWNEKKYFMDEN